MKIQTRRLSISLTSLPGPVASCVFSEIPIGHLFACGPAVYEKTSDDLALNLSAGIFRGFQFGEYVAIVHQLQRVEFETIAVKGDQI